MFPAAIKMQMLTVFIVLMISAAYGQDRKITSILNPFCDNNCDSNDTLLYIRADGSHDTVHQIWDFTGKPTMIFIISGLNATVNMTWERRTPQRIWLSEAPKYSFAVALDKLYEYNDLQDNGYIDASSPRKEFSFDDRPWLRDELVRSDREVRLQMKMQYPVRGHVQVKLDLLPFKDYAVELPHLIHTANSTLMDISLVNLMHTREYNASRYALRLLMVGMDDSSLSMNYTIRKSLDDEHTPGVFEIIEIRTPASARGGAGGFLQFRPVGYTQRERSVASSTIAHVSAFNTTRIGPHEKTLKNFYQQFDQHNILAQNMFVSFGETGDGYYKQHNFTAWSLTVGYGSPPVESFSTFVIIIISIGLGVPVLLALSGVVYVLVRRYRKPAPTRLIDDQ